MTRAQLVIYSDNFDSYPGYEISDWPYVYSGIVPWQAGLPGQVGICMLPVGGPMSAEASGNKVACIADCGTFNPNDSNVLSYTPHISLSGITGAWLKYDSYFNEYHDIYGDTERATVEISTDTGNTWTVIQQVHQSVPNYQFATQYVDLSAYDNAPDIRIGFRYSDDGGWMQGWAIDNVEVFMPARKDLALLSMTPGDPLKSYQTIGQGFTHSAQVFNAGLDTIHQFVLNYRQGSGPVMRDTVTGASLLPFSTTTFAHTIPDTVAALGSYPVTMWVTLDSDSYHYNDTAHAVLNGANFIPAKQLAMECGDGTWYSWSPRNYVYYDSLPSLDIPACRVSVHDGDIMEDPVYDTFTLQRAGGYFPYMNFDRRIYVPMDSFFTYVNSQRSVFGFANLDLGGTLNGQDLTVNVTVKPAVNLSGDYRLALVLTEDNINNGGYAYNQANGYAGGANGEMHGYELLPTVVPASQMTYNHVARAIIPQPTGAPGSLPASMDAGGTYSYTFNTTVDSAWQLANVHAMVFFINNGDSTIMNANELNWTLSTPTVAIKTIDAALFPNPANERATLRFDMSSDGDVHIDVMDIAGRMVYQSPYTHFSAGRSEVTLPVGQLPAGVYLVELRCREGNKSLKLEVAR